MLEVEVGGIKLKNPVMQASGILGGSKESLLLVARARPGALVTKTITPEPREGYPTPIAIKVPCGYLNAVGLANPGIKGIPRLLEAGRESGLEVIVSIGGFSKEDFVKVASAVAEAGGKAVEVNLSCPHVKGGGLEIGTDPKLVSEILKDVKSTGLKVFAKLGYTHNLIELAGRALEHSDALVLINTLKGMKIDVFSMKPVLGNKVGGLSGLAIHPIAVRAVYEVYKEYRADIVGVGGVYSWEEAVELILAGAKAVQVGSAIIEKGVEVLREIRSGIAWWLGRMGFKEISEAVGMAHD